MIITIFIFTTIGIYTRYHPCLSHDKVFAKLLTSKAVLGKRPLEVQVQNNTLSNLFVDAFYTLLLSLWYHYELFGTIFFTNNHALFMTTECIDQKASLGVNHKFHHTTCEVFMHKTAIILLLAILQERYLSTLMPLKRDVSPWKVL